MSILTRLRGKFTLAFGVVLKRNEDRVVTRLPAPGDMQVRGIEQSLAA